MDNFVKGMITQILNVSSFTTEIASLKTTIQSFNTDVFSTILDVVKSTTFAIGAALLTLFMLMEFVGMVNRYNSDGGITGIKLPANIMIKFGIISFLFCNFYKVLMGMQGIGVELCNGLVTKFGGDPNITMNTYSLVTQISDIINNFDIINKIIIIIILIIIWIAVQGIMIIIKCTVYFRLFETYLLFIFSPIPLSTIPSNEFRSVGINFLKSFAALSIQGAVIIASFFIYSKLITTLLDGILSAGISTDDPITVINAIFVPIISYLVVLCSAVFASGRISKSIMNAV